MAAVYFKSGDRYDSSTATVVCVPTIGHDNSTNIYKIAFCWSTKCPQLAKFANSNLRAWMQNVAVTPATGPAGLADTPIVYINLAPDCANVVSTISMQGGTGTYRFESAQKLQRLPSPGIDTLDIDVRTHTAICDDQWCVRGKHKGGD